MHGEEGTWSPTGDLSAAGAGRPTGRSDWQHWSAQDDDDAGLWLTIAPGVQARADASSVSPGEALPSAATGGGRSGPQHSSGGVHRASGDSMGAAGPHPTEGRTSSGAAADVGGPAGARGGPATDGTSARVASRSDPAGGSGFARRLLLGLSALAAAAVVAVLLRVVASQAVAEPSASTAPIGVVDEPGAAASEPPSGDAPGATAGGLATSSAASAPKPRPSGAADWWQVLEQLDERRSDVLSRLDLSGVTSYAAAGSDYWRGEVALVGRLLGQRLRPRGWRTSVVAIEDVQGPNPGESGSSSGGGSASEVTLTIVDERSAYDLIDDHGAVARSVGKSGTRRWRLTLVPGADDPGDGPGTADDRGESARPSAVGTGRESTDAPSGSPSSAVGSSPAEAGTDVGRADARSAVADDVPAADVGEVAAEREAPIGTPAATPAPDQSSDNPGALAMEDRAPPTPGSTWRITAVEPVS